MTKHIHAELMRQYAEDAMQTEEPWLLWEYCNDGKWKQCTVQLSWSKSGTFRRKPEFIKVGDYEFPKPVSKEPNKYDGYWYVEISTDQGFCAHQTHWDNSREDVCRLRCGLIHNSVENAQQHADVLNKIHQIRPRKGDK